MTTSRKPGVLCKRLGRLLAGVLPFGQYENRGKASMGDVIAKARALGKNRVVFVTAQQGNPHALEFARVGLEDDDWEWLSPALRIKRVSGEGNVPKQKVSGLEISGKQAELGAQLFGIESKTPEGARASQSRSSGEPVTLEAGDGKLAFVLDKKKVLEIGFEIIKEGEHGTDA